MYKKSLYIKPETQIEKATLEKFLMVVSSGEKNQKNHSSHNTDNNTSVPKGNAWGWRNGNSNHSNKDLWAWDD